MDQDEALKLLRRPEDGNLPRTRLSSLYCFSMLEFMPDSVPSRRAFQVGMQ
jgi:hypothetical protein